MGVFRLISTRRENRPYPLRVSDMDRRVRAVISLMQTELDRKLSILELAHRVNLSGGHFSRLFKAETAQTPKSFLRILRMQRGMQLVQGTFLTLKEITGSLGIDRSHFSRDFKAVRGESSSKLRKHL